MATKDIDIPALYSDYDWLEVFGQGSGGNTTRNAEAVFGGAPVSTAEVDIQDVVTVIGTSNGENDGAEWVGAFKLKDGRYVVASGGCDYTGWDCRAGNSITVAGTYDDMMKFALDEFEKRRLGLWNIQKEEEYTMSRALSSVDEKDLLAEIERRRQVKIQEEKDRREVHNKWVVDNIDLLLKITPKHDLSNCSDNTPYNNLSRGGKVDCLRCFLLDIKLTGVVDSDVKITARVNVEEYSSLESPD